MVRSLESKEIENIKTKIIDAIKRGEAIEFIYQGGSQPNKKRKVLFNSLKQNIAYGICLTTGKLKSFNIIKISFANSNTEYKPPQPQPFGYESIQDIIKYELEKLLSLGWHVKYSEKYIYLFKRKKDGTPLKTPKVVIKFSPPNIYEEKEKQWYVSGENISTFKHFNKASIKFLYYAEKLSNK